MHSLWQLVSSVPGKRQRYNHDADYDGVWGYLGSPVLTLLPGSCSGAQNAVCASVFTVSPTIPTVSRLNWLIISPAAHHGYSPQHPLCRLFPSGIFSGKRPGNPGMPILFLSLPPITPAQPIADEYKQPSVPLPLRIIFFTPDHSLNRRQYRGGQQIDIMPSPAILSPFDQPYFLHLAKPVRQPADLSRSSYDWQYLSADLG